jgi:hypothetical protein
LVGIDISVLLRQQKLFLQSDAAVATFGPLQPQLQAFGAEMLEVFHELVPVRVLSERERQQSQQRFDALARQHPITDISYSRSSVFPFIVELSQANNRTVTGVVGAIDDRMATLHVYGAIFMNWLPSLSRWQFELAAHRLRNTEDAQKLIQAGTQVHDTAADISIFIKEFPAILTKERQAALADVQAQLVEIRQQLQAERKLILAHFDEQLATFMAAISDERAMVTATIAEERALVLASLEQARLQSLEDLRQERIAFEHGLQAVLREQVDATMDELNETGLTMRTYLERLLLFAGLCFVGAIAFVCWWFRRCAVGRSSI